MKIEFQGINKRLELNRTTLEAIDQKQLIATNIDNVTSTLYIDNYPKAVIYVSPTNNCQVTSIASFCNIVSHVNNITELKSIVAEISKFTEKRLILVDLKQLYADKLCNLIKEKSILVKSSYRSTNDSRMCLILFNSTLI